MATFTNRATLSYNGRTTDSNIVTGTLTETLSVTKTALTNTYSAFGTETYVISLVNTGAVPYTGLTVTDDLGAYTDGTSIYYPLSYREDSLQYYVNGILQVAPTVVSTEPLTISGINVPAGGNAILVYDTDLTGLAPLDAAGQIVNTATVTGAGLTTPVSDTETVNAVAEAELTITKALSPTVVPENGTITYTFTIQNFGNTDAVATDNVTVTDTFDPILNGITVTYQGTAWAEGVNYNYDPTTGVFTTVPSQITVPAATYTRAETGEWIVNPGSVTLTVTGTI